MGPESRLRRLEELERAARAGEPKSYRDFTTGPELEELFAEIEKYREEGSPTWELDEDIAREVLDEVRREMETEDKED